jgi:hypothetical protein
MPKKPDSRTVAYHFELPDGSIRQFAVSVDAGALMPAGVEPPAWAELDVHKCPHCTLDTAENPWCPAALSISEVVEAFGDLWSHQIISLTVITPERSFMFEDVQLQDALRSFMGLVVATSGCPHTGFFRPMARFHMPMSSVEETVYRATSMYLLGQWFRRSERGEGELDLSGLTELYNLVKLVNVHLHRRLGAAVETDSSQNAVALLGTFSQLLPMAVEKSLAPLRPLFESYVCPPAPRDAAGEDPDPV